MVEDQVWYGPLTRYVKLQVAHAPGMPGTFSPSPRVNEPDMPHGTCMAHVLWCMPGSLTSNIVWSRWRGKRSRHSMGFLLCGLPEWELLVIVWLETERKCSIHYITLKQTHLLIPLCQYWIYIYMHILHFIVFSTVENLNLGIDFYLWWFETFNWFNILL